MYLIRLYVTVFNARVFSFVLNVVINSCLFDGDVGTATIFKNSAKSALCDRVYKFVGSLMLYLFSALWCLAHKKHSNNQNFSNG